MIARALMRVAGTLARSSVLSPLTETFFASRANIVYYHGVWQLGSTSFKSLGGVTLDTFEKDMRLLCRFFSPISLSQLLDSNVRGAAGSEPLFTVTFDDGCDLTRSGATDVLDHLGIRATTFVVVDCVGNRHLMWQHKFSAIQATKGTEVFLREFNRVAEKIKPGTGIPALPSHVAVSKTWPMCRKDEFADEIWRACDMPAVEEFLEAERPYVNWEDLEDWRRRGHHVGLHTKTHPFCSQLDATEAIDEIEVPARALTEVLRQPTVPFAYPFGDRLHDRAAQQIFRNAPLSCMLGIDGPSLLGTAVHRLGRARGETDINVSVFSKPMAKALRALLTV